jgi:hypothetical protein
MCLNAYMFHFHAYNYTGIDTRKLQKFLEVQSKKKHVQITCFKFATMGNQNFTYEAHRCTTIYIKIKIYIKIYREIQS